MLCDVCQEPAVGACRACGIGFCADHGSSYCVRCATAIVPCDPQLVRRSTATYTPIKDRPVPTGKGYLQCESQERPTIYLDDPAPPACHHCQGRAHRVCRNCQELFCTAHGRGELCITCRRSSRLGLIILAIFLMLFAAMWFFAWLWPRLRMVLLQM